MSIITRKAEIKDTELILSLIKELAIYEELLHEVVATEDMLRETLFAENPRAQVIIAECDGEEVGFALYYYTYSTFLGRAGMHLEDLFVMPDYRGRGVGKMLLSHLAEIALKEGLGRLEWAVLDWNESAIDFYESIGAIAMKEWFTFRMTEKEMKVFVGDGNTT